jgi:hypothetical protein
MMVYLVVPIGNGKDARKKISEAALTWQKILEEISKCEKVIGA